MSIRRTSWGDYRARLMIDGRRYSATLPTREDARDWERLLRAGVRSEAQAAYDHAQHAVDRHAAGRLDHLTPAELRDLARRQQAIIDNQPAFDPAALERAHTSVQGDEHGPTAPHQTSEPSQPGSTCSNTTPRPTGAGATPPTPRPRSSARSNTSQTVVRAPLSTGDERRQLPMSSHRARRHPTHGWEAGGLHRADNGGCARVGATRLVQMQSP